MTHEHVMSERDRPDEHDPNPHCQEVVEVVHRGFWDDVNWTVYRCPRCDIRIAAVGGGRHWWNYVLSDRSANRLGVPA